MQNLILSHLIIKMKNRKYNTITIFFFLWKSSIHEKHKHIHIPEISDCFIKWLISDTVHLRKSFTNIYTLCAMKNVHSVSSSVDVRWGARRAESEEKKMRRGSQASFSVGIAVQG